MAARSAFVFAVALAVSLFSAACSEPSLPRFARPPDAGAPQQDAAADEDGG